MQHFAFAYCDIAAICIARSFSPCLLGPNEMDGLLVPPGEASTLQNVHLIIG